MLNNILSMAAINRFAIWEVLLIIAGLIIFAGVVAILLMLFQLFLCAKVVKKKFREYRTTDAGKVISIIMPVSLIMAFIIVLTIIDTFLVNLNAFVYIPIILAIIGLFILSIVKKDKSQPEESQKEDTK